MNSSDRETGGAPTDLRTDTRPVLVAVDFSEDSRAALMWAADYAGMAGARLLVLHVVHDPADQPGYYQAARKQVLQPMETAAGGMLDEFLAAARAARPDLAALESAGKMLLTGLPAGRIVEAAELEQATLIVIGSRGMSGLPHILQGSVSERVVELAGGPVAVVKAGKPAGGND